MNKIVNEVVDEVVDEVNTVMVKREEVPNSPFVVVTVEEGSFGTLGKWRITELCETSKEVFDDLSVISWNRVIQVVQLILQADSEGLINKDVQG